METYTVAIFGEAEKGDYCKAYFCSALSELVAYLGNPPPETSGLYYAIQTLLYEQNLIFFRVREEGFSSQDYLSGFYLLQKNGLISEVAAVGIPGVGDANIVDALAPICASNHSILLTTEADLYDYMTSV